MLKHLETYIHAQKVVATNSIGLGVLLILLAVLLHFIGNSELSKGLKIGFICLGLFSIGGGYTYQKFSENLFEKQSVLQQQNATQFHQEETVRMEKVAKTFPIYQIVFIVIIVVSLLVIFFTNKGLVQGICFSVVFFFLGNMIIEKLSKTSIDKYIEQLANINL